MYKFLNVKVKKLSSTAQLPEFQTQGAAGADLYADADVDIPSGEWKLVSLGFSTELPRGTEAQIRPRSGLALKHGVTVLNAPATVDADYRGEWKIILVNHGKKTFRVSKGDRIAQTVIAKLDSVRFYEKKELSTTSRGSGGFGSTEGF